MRSVLSEEKLMGWRREVEVSAATCPGRGMATYAGFCQLGVGSETLSMLTLWL